jgi:hypothetical protein
MLSLNSISISSSDSKVLDEIYDILKSESMDTDISKYHSYTEDNIRFLSLFFNEDKPYDDFGIEWAYIESCEKSDVISTNIYSYNGNLSIWVAELTNKYKMYKPIDFKIDISIEITKSVRFKNYDIEQSWIETKLPEPNEINKKGYSKE